MRGSAIGDTNRRASHPSSAISNYAYGVLQSRVSIACVASGLDPSAGVIHARRRGRPGLTLDLMEPLRPLTDARVLDFIRSHAFARADFPVGNDGVVSLHPQLGRAVSASKVEDRLVPTYIQAFINCLEGLDK